MPTLRLVLVSIATCVALDGLWLGLLMAKFYRTQLGPIARMNGGSLSPIWSVAGLTYVAIAIGIVAFVVPRAATPVAAAGWGALFGLVVFGVYDLTNLSTLRGWPVALTMVDLCWGTMSCAANGFITKTIEQWR